MFEGQVPDPDVRNLRAPGSTTTSSAVQGAGQIAGIGADFLGALATIKAIDDRATAEGRRAQESFNKTFVEDELSAAVQEAEVIALEEVQGLKKVEEGLRQGRAGFSQTRLESAKRAAFKKVGDKLEGFGFSRAQSEGLMRRAMLDLKIEDPEQKLIALEQGREDALQTALNTQFNDAVSRGLVAVDPDIPVDQQSRQYASVAGNYVATVQQLRSLGYNITQEQIKEGNVPRQDFLEVLNGPANKTFKDMSRLLQGTFTKGRTLLTGDVFDPRTLVEVGEDLLDQRFELERLVGDMKVGLNSAEKKILDDRLNGIMELYSPERLGIPSTYTDQYAKATQTAVDYILLGGGAENVLALQKVMGQEAFATWYSSLPVTQRDRLEQTGIKEIVKVGDYIAGRGTPAPPDDPADVDPRDEVDYNEGEPDVVKSGVAIVEAWTTGQAEDSMIRLTGDVNKDHTVELLAPNEAGYNQVQAGVLAATNKKANSRLFSDADRTKVESLVSHDKTISAVMGEGKTSQSIITSTRSYAYLEDQVSAGLQRVVTALDQDMGEGNWAMVVGLPEEQRVGSEGERPSRQPGQLLARKEGTGAIKIGPITLFTREAKVGPVTTVGGQTILVNRQRMADLERIAKSLNAMNKYREQTSPAAAGGATVDTMSDEEFWEFQQATLVDKKILSQAKGDEVEG
jgi:hypothetical protein